MRTPLPANKFAVQRNVGGENKNGHPLFIHSVLLERGYYTDVVPAAATQIGYKCHIFRVPRSLLTAREGTMIVYMDSKRVIMRIEVPPNVPAAIDTSKELFGATHISVYSRLILWFCQQDELTQGAILRLLPDIADVDIPRRVMERVRGSGRTRG
jgi:hypothetical protein